MMHQHSSNFGDKTQGFCELIICNMYHWGALLRRSIVGCRLMGLKIRMVLHKPSEIGNA